MLVAMLLRCKSTFRNTLEKMVYVLTERDFFILMKIHANKNSSTLSVRGTDKSEVGGVILN